MIWLSLAFYVTQRMLSISSESTSGYKIGTSTFVSTIRTSRSRKDVSKLAENTVKTSAPQLVVQSEEGRRNDL